MIEQALAKKDKIEIVCPDCLKTVEVRSDGNWHDEDGKALEVICSPTLQINVFRAAKEKRGSLLKFYKKAAEQGMQKLNYFWVLCTIGERQQSRIILQLLNGS